MSSEQLLSVNNPSGPQAWPSTGESWTSLVQTIPPSEWNHRPTLHSTQWKACETGREAIHLYSCIMFLGGGNATEKQQANESLNMTITNINIRQFESCKFIVYNNRLLSSQNYTRRNMKLQLHQQACTLDTAHCLMYVDIQLKARLLMVCSNYNGKFVIIAAIISIIIITYHLIYNYIPEANHVSRIQSIQCCSYSVVTLHVTGTVVSQ